MAKKTGAENTDVQKNSESGTAEPGATVETAAGGNQAPQETVLPENEAPVLKSVHSWANEKRLATWQTAMLIKAQGWLADKKVSREEFDKAMANALKRKQGGI